MIIQSCPRNKTRVVRLGPSSNREDRRAKTLLEDYYTLLLIRARVRMESNKMVLGNVLLCNLCHSVEPNAAFSSQCWSPRALARLVEGKSQSKDLLPARDTGVPTRPGIHWLVTDPVV